MTEEVKIKNLPLLQNKIKKDPSLYESDFLKIFSEFDELWNSLLLNPSSHEEDIITFSIFIAQVSHCYKKKGEEFADKLIHFLTNQGPILDADMRLSLCRALILMRNKDIVPAVQVLQLFFILFRCTDKILRGTLKNYIVQDIRNINKKKANLKLNSALQNYMYTMLKDHSEVAAKISLDIVIELYQKRVWNTAKTANIISTAIFSKSNKLVVAALNFFIGSGDDRVVDSEDEDDEAGQTDKRSKIQLQLANRVAKKTKKREKRLARAQAFLKQKDKKKKRKNNNSCFSALHLINDPQELADKVYSQLDKAKTNDLFEVKVLKMNFISQLVAIHKLILLQFYPYVNAYLKPHQKDVTKLLLFVAQACHDLVPPDIVYLSIQQIANNFVSERNRNEVIAVGLNAIREVCNRCPLAMNETLLHDLALFRKDKDKCISRAAQALIGLFRLKNPALLHRTFRGRQTMAMTEQRLLEYGEVDAKDYIPGTDVLPGQGEEGMKEGDGWESCSDADDKDNDEEWVDVHHSSDEDDKKEEDEDEKEGEPTAEERIEKSRQIMETRILSEEDFKRISAAQEDKLKKYAGKRSRPSNEVEEIDRFLGDSNCNGETVPLANIENVHKRRKHDKDARVAAVKEGREGRDKFGSTKGKKNQETGTTNKAKSRKKNFMMVRQKVLKKQKRTFQDKKESLKKRLLTQLNKKR